MKYDVFVIGAGVIGSLIARELSSYDLKVAVIDKENDVGNVVSSANSAIIHSGYDPLPGTLKAKFNVLGNKMFDPIAEELDVSFSRIGSLTIALNDKELQTLFDLKKRSEENGVETKILSAQEVIALEKNISSEVKGALFAPSCGIIDPFNLVIHAMENAVDNGVTLYLDEEVIDIKYQNDEFIIKTNKREFVSKIVINAAGLCSDKIAKMIEDIDWKIIPKKGEYFVLDHFTPHLVDHVIFPLPSQKGKGTLVTLTTSGNILVGPSSELIDDVNDSSTDSLTLSLVKEQASKMVDNIPFKEETIRVFSGVRPTTNRHDFIIEYAKTNNHFINVAGIESPGLVSSPAIAKYVVEKLVSPLIVLSKKENYDPYVKKYVRMAGLSEENKNELIKKNPHYGEMICFCEKISLGEVEDLFKRSVPPTTIKAIKKRVRPGFGRCQGGMCSPLILKLLSNYYQDNPLTIKWDKDFSFVLKENVKESKNEKR